MYSMCIICIIYITFVWIFYEYIISINIIIFILFLVANLPDPVYCPKHCGRHYSGVNRKGNLTKHLKYYCGAPRQFQCSICSKKFARKYNLKTHCFCVHKLLMT